MRKIGISSAFLLTIGLLASCTITRPTVTQIVIEPPLFMLAHPLSFKSNRGTFEMTVPMGFVTDLASIPRLLWWWQSPHESTMAPAILHDYLYWQQTCTKDESDAVMYLALVDVGLNFAERSAVYAGIRNPVAQTAWDNNRQARARGELRFFTEPYARQLLGSIVDPQASLDSIRREATMMRGMYAPAENNRALKSACQAALREFNMQAES